MLLCFECVVVEMRCHKPKTESVTGGSQKQARFLSMVLIVWESFHYSCIVYNLCNYLYYCKDRCTLHFCRFLFVLQVSFLHSQASSSAVVSTLQEDYAFSAGLGLISTSTSVNQSRTRQIRKTAQSCSEGRKTTILTAVLISLEWDGEIGADTNSCFLDLHKPLIFNISRTSFTNDEHKPLIF